MIIQEPVQAAIWHCLNHYDVQNATFLAERLYAEVETEETIFILATCYYRSNQIHQAYWLLQSKSPHSSQCRFLLAKCAYQLKKLSEAESALSLGNTGFIDSKNFDEICREFGECACFALQLIAKICSKTERFALAAEAYKMALKLNPFLWNSFAELCNFGEKVDPNSIFQIQNSNIFNTCQGNNANAMVLLGGNVSENMTMGNIGGGFGIGTINTAIQQHPDIIGTTTLTVGTDIVTNSNSNNINNNNNNNNSTNNHILTTPTSNIESNNLILQQQQQQQQSILNITTPNKINNLSSSPTVRSSVGGGVIVNVANNNNNNNNNNSNNNNNNNNNNNSGNGTTNCPPSENIEDTPIYLASNSSNYDGGSPFIKQFKYLSSVNQQITPSFGILPFNSPNETYSFSNLSLMTPSPQATLIEVNQESKSIGKKLKGHVGNIMRKEGPLQQSKSTAIFTQTGNITPRTPNNNLSGQNVRRSSRLFSNNYSVKENNKSPNINKFAQPRSPPRKIKQRGSKISLNNELNEKDKKEKQKIETITSDDSKILLNNSLNAAQTMAHHVLALKKQSAEGLMNLLRELGQGYLHLSQYNCKEAMDCFSIIPKHHYKTSWVQSMIALAHHEQREYEIAANIFQKIHEMEPYRMHLMEIYSTSLWHLQREVALSALSQDLIAQDKMSPVTWCVAGNCFSLHKEHETAIKYFKRAVQVNPDFVYSYTLLGHELVITEELDKAMSCFRTAILKDPRHYNAWFGIGTIYSKQERYELAELHYKRALKINPKNSVIMVHVGAMQYFMQKAELALQTLNSAIAVDPKNPLCKFHRGSMYYSLGKHQEALRELEELKQIVPKESVVFYLIGKIHKNLGNVDSALMHFSWATDLDPKGANNQLKDAFDSINHSTLANQAADLNLENENDPSSERSDDSTETEGQLDPNAYIDFDPFI